MIDISVVICTYNRCESLKSTLDSFLKQECDGTFDYEVIIVDNNSKDKTKNVVESYNQKFNSHLKYVFEQNQGLSYARNRGIKESKGKIIAFTDDDCIVERRWLLKIWTKFKDNNDIDVILGNGFWENGKPIYEKGDMDILRGNGLNMSFRSQIFKEIALFDVFLGPGSMGCSADDTEFIYRLSKRNKKIVFCDEITIVHKHRVDLSEERNIFYRDVKGHMIFLLKHALRERDSYALKTIYWSVCKMLSGLFNAIKSNNLKRVRWKLVHLRGIFVGLTKGIYIWLIISPLKDQYAKS